MDVSTTLQATHSGYFGAKTYVEQWNSLSDFYPMAYPAMIAGAERPSCERERGGR